jgi:hypothetical protein
MIALTRGAQAPVHHFGLVDDKAMIVGRLKARRITDRAVDIDRRLAPPTDEVVVIVPHPSLVKCRAARRFDPANDPRRDERVEIVVHRLPRYRPQPPPRRRRDKLRVPMLAFQLNHVQHRQPRRRQSQTRLPKQLLDIDVHRPIMPRYLDQVQINPVRAYSLLKIVSVPPSFWDGSCPK